LIALGGKCSKRAEPIGPLVLSDIVKAHEWRQEELIGSGDPQVVGATLDGLAPRDFDRTGWSQGGSVKFKRGGNFKCPAPKWL